MGEKHEARGGGPGGVSRGNSPLHSTLPISFFYRAGNFDVSPAATVNSDAAADFRAAFRALFWVGFGP